MNKPSPNGEGVPLVAQLAVTLGADGSLQAKGQFPNIVVMMGMLRAAELAFLKRLEGPKIETAASFDK